MEENRTSSTKQSLNYGLILGLVLILFSLVMFLLEVDRESWINWLSVAFMAIVLLLVMINFRDKHLMGEATFGNMFGVGFKTTLFGAILAAIYSFIFFTVIDPGMMDEIIRNAEEEMMNNPDMTDEQIDQALEFTERFFANPVTLTIFGFLFNLIIGTILSLIISIFVKREGSSPVV
jgi:hypothetical protein